MSEQRIQQILFIKQTYGISNIRLSFLLCFSNKIEITTILIFVFYVMFFISRNIFEFIAFASN